MEKPTLVRYATEEDYEKRKNWNVGTFHRVSTFQAVAPSSGEGPKEEPASLGPELGGAKTGPKRRPRK